MRDAREPRLDITTEAPPSRRAQGGEAPATGRGPRTGRVFIDCTWTHVTGRKMGIQRVVRNVCSRSAEVGRGLGVRCIPVVYDRSRFWGAWKPGPGPQDPASLDQTTRFRGLLQSASFFLAGVLHFALPRRAEFTRTLLTGVSRVLLSPPTWRGRKERIRWQAGDVLILLDASWNLDFRDALADARKAGVRVVAVVYDLIPLTHPHYCGKGHVRVFKAWLEDLREYADAFLTISDTVRGDLARHFRSDPPVPGRDARPVDYFHLGCDFRPRGANGRVREGVKKAAGAYLTVGTIEPRKNHVCLLDAFEKVWETRPEAGLCIVGAAGPDTGTLRERVRRHPLHGKRLFMFHDLSDAELCFCYARTRALILPSLVEGFGLPLVEALHQGAPVFANDIPPFREIGEAHCVFFDGTAPESLARIVLDYETGGRLPVRRSPKEFQWPDWTESCRSLLSKALEAPPSRRAQDAEAARDGARGGSHE